MKNILQLKVWSVALLIMSGILGLVLVTSCGTDEGTVSPSTGKSSSGKSDGDSSRSKLNFVELKADGSCAKDDDCVDWCKDDLELSGSNRDACEELDKDIVKDLVDLFEEILEKPSAEELEDLNTDDITLMGSAIKTLGKQILEQKTEDYSRPTARDFLAWMAKNEEVLEVFKVIDEDEEALEILKSLFEKVSANENEEAILNGLKEQIGEEDGEHFLALAEDNNNRDLITYIHGELIEDEEEVCDDNNYPTATTGQTGATDRADHNQEACYLAVYCYIAPAEADNDDNEEFRKKISEIINVNFDRLVHDAIADGGLGLTDRDAEEWTDAACEALDTYWSDGNLNLGLH